VPAGESLPILSFREVQQQAELSNSSALIGESCDLEMLLGLARDGWATARQYTFGRAKYEVLNARITEAVRKAIG
jgi:hypothetical protein